VSTTFSRVTYPAINDVAWPFSFVMFGVRPDDGDGSSLISKGGNLSFRDNSASVSNQVSFQRNATSVDAFARSVSTWTVADGLTHYAVTVSAAGLVKLYKNGSEVSYNGTTSGSGTIASDAANDLVIDLNSLDHFAFYNIELSSGQVSSLYASGAGVNCYTVASGNILVSTDTQSSSPVLAAVPAAQRNRRSRGRFM
jgi:hypothetical protein